MCVEQIKDFENYGDEIPKDWEKYAEENGYKLMKEETGGFTYQKRIQDD